MPNKTWKNLERKVAKLLGGKRIPCSGVAEGFKGDVEHKHFFIECKWGKQIPKTIVEWFRKAEKQAPKDKIPILIMKPKGMHREFVLIKLEHFAFIYKDTHAYLFTDEIKIEPKRKKGVKNMDII